MARRFNQLIPLWPSLRGGYAPHWGGMGPVFRNMEQQMQAMEKHMNDMFNDFGQMGPLDSEAEHEMFKNPVVTDKDGNRKMQLQFDIRHFKPEEVRIRTENNTLTVHAKHESEGESSKISREYQRRITLPEGVEAEQMTSQLSPDGALLTIEAPLPAETTTDAEPKSIPIEHVKDKE